VAHAAPVPTRITGRWADFQISISSSREAGSGYGVTAGRQVREPYAIAFLRGGWKRMSIGKSTTTGPGTPPIAVLYA
jgi:hypothetical protein